MKILHLCSYYPGSPLYKNLFSSIPEGIEQLVIVPLLYNRFVEKELEFSIDLSFDIKYETIWNRFHRLFFRRKIKLATDMVKLSLRDQTIIHAHTWFSDGAIAFELKKELGIPYAITIRNTDINFFYKYRYDLRKYGQDILRNASKIVFVSPSYINILRKHIPTKLYKSIHPKFIFIPNAIDDFWFINSPTRLIANKDKNILYIGDINENKNIRTLIKAFLKTNRICKMGQLMIVGFRDVSKYEKQIKMEFCNFKNIQFVERKKKDELKNIFEVADIFVMISKQETFGLVYVEALSQGLPIIYTKNQGVDGVFENTNIGIRVDPNDIDDISKALVKIISNYENFQKNTISQSKKFNWKTVGWEHYELYKSMS